MSAFLYAQSRDEWFPLGWIRTWIRTCPIEIDRGSIVFQDKSLAQIRIGTGWSFMLSATELEGARPLQHGLAYSPSRLRWNCDPGVQSANAEQPQPVESVEESAKP